MLVTMKITIIVNRFVYPWIYKDGAELNWTEKYSL